MSKSRAALACLAVLTFCLAGCGSGEPGKSAFADDPAPSTPAPQPGSGSQAQPSAQPQADAASRGGGSGSRTLEIPGEEKLPDGHPPIGSQSGSGMDISVQAPGSGMALRWDIPAGWEQVEPASSMRYAQYKVPGPGGDGECVVFYFGPGQGGDPQANAVRWAQQFSQPDGSDPVQAMSVDRLEGGKVDALVVRTRGTYSGGMAMMGSTQSLENYALLGGIARGADAFWFYKFTGPAATVDANEAAFKSMKRSVHIPGPSS